MCTSRKHNGRGGGRGTRTRGGGDPRSAWLTQGPPRQSPALTLSLKAISSSLLAASWPSFSKGMRCPWPLRSVPQVLGRGGPGRPKGRPDATYCFCRQGQSVPGGAGPGPEAGHRRPAQAQARGEEREGHSRALRRHCQQPNVLWKHSR